jgi:rubrerythrin
LAFLLLNGEQKMKENNIETPLEVEINCDGYYPYCKNCGYFDLEHEQERCPKCGQLQDWSWLEKGENNGL